MPVVGTLTVDLVANTATFSGDLGKAAQSAENFGQSAARAGQAMDFSMREARGSMMLMGEELGVHLPRELRTLIAEIPGVGLAFEAMLPIVGVVAAVAIIEKLIAKHKEAAKEMADASSSVSHAVQKNTDDTKIKLLELEKQFDELNGNHVKVLVDELRLLDATTLQHLGGELEAITKQGDKVFAAAQKMETSFWLGGQWNSAAAQVKSDLDAFNAKLETIVATGTKGEVAAVVQHLTDVTAALNKEQALQSKETGHMDRVNALKQELTLAQELSQEYSNADKIEDAEKRNDVAKSSNEAAATAKKNAEIITKAFQEADKELIAGFQKYSHTSDAAMEKQLGWEGKLAAASEATAKAQTEGIQDVLKSQESLSEAMLKFASSQNRDDIKKQAELGIISKREEMESIAALDQQELQQARSTHQAALAELQQHLEAMKAAQATAKGGEDEAKAIEATTKAQVALNAENTRFIALQSQLQTAIKANDAAALKLESSWAIYFTKMHAETQDLGTTLRTSLQNNLDTMVDGFASGMSKMIMEGKSFGQAMRGVAVEVGENMLNMIIKVGLQDLASKLLMKQSAASLAGANMTASFAGAPWPIDMGAPAEGAAAFASAMAFEYGGEIPGYGPTPIIAHGGETVVTKALTDHVRNSDGGGSGKGHTVNVTTHIHAVDAEGFGKLLNKHASVVSAHVTGQLRKMNKRG